MELRQLTYFVTAAELGNITQAAQRLNVSQPPVSRQIRALEHELGFALFERVPQGVVLTAGGAQFLRDARRIIADTEAARRAGLAATRGDLGSLDVASYGSTVYRVVPRALTALLAARPGIDIRMRRLGKADQIAALQRREIDIGFGRYYDLPDGMEVLTVAREPMVLAYSTREGRSLPDPMPVADAVRAPLVVFPASGRPSFADHLLTSLAAAGLSVHVAAEVEDATSALAQVAMGTARCIAPVSVAALQLEGVRFVSLSGLDLRAPVHAVHLTEHRSPVLGAFLDILPEVDLSSAG